VAFLVAALSLGAAATLLADQTGATGGSQPHINDQPSLGITYTIALQGVFPSSNPGADTFSHYIGEVVMFACNFAPQGYAPASGQLLSIAQNPALYQLIGNTYGGDGQVTFALPKLNARAVLGQGQGPGFTNRPLGTVVGQHTDTLTIAQMPSHDHSTPFGPSGFTGGGQPVPVMQPSLALNYFVNENGSFGTPTPSGLEPFVGQVRMTAGVFSPGGEDANGQLVQVSQYPNLASLIGNKYGGDGVTTIGLPDLRGRVVIGSGTGTALTPRAQGSTVGAEQVTLTDSQLPSHVHSFPGGGSTGSDGGGQPYSIMQPSMALHYIIATDGIFPSRNFGPEADQPFISEITPYLGDTAPAGWAFCEGQILPIAGNEALFQLVGTFYGGDGMNTFGLPDLRGRVPLGNGIGDGGFPMDLGEFFGSETDTLSVSQIPSHTHTVPEPAGVMILLAGAAGAVPAGRRHRRTH
jgi:microcystin-dependent protein